MEIVWLKEKSRTHAHTMPGRRESHQMRLAMRLQKKSDSHIELLKVISGSEVNRKRMGNRIFRVAARSDTVVACFPLESPHAFIQY